MLGWGAIAISMISWLCYQQPTANDTLNQGCSMGVTCQTARLLWQSWHGSGRTRMNTIRTPVNIQSGLDFYMWGASVCVCVCVCLCSACMYLYEGTCHMRKEAAQYFKGALPLTSCLKSRDGLGAPGSIPPPADWKVL